MGGTLQFIAAEVNQVKSMVGILSDHLTVEVVNPDIAVLFKNLNRYPVDFSDMRKATPEQTGIPRLAYPETA